MNGLKRKLLGLGASLAIAGTVALGGTAATVATAQPAEAATVSSCTRYWSSAVKLVRETCRINYNWAEEVFLSKKDGTYYRWCQYGNSYIYGCGKWMYKG